MSDLGQREKPKNDDLPTVTPLQRKPEIKEYDTTDAQLWTREVSLGHLAFILRKASALYTPIWTELDKQLKKLRADPSQSWQDRTRDEHDCVPCRGKAKAKRLACNMWRFYYRLSFGFTCGEFCYYLWGARDDFSRFAAGEQVEIATLVQRLCGILTHHIHWQSDFREEAVDFLQGLLAVDFRACVRQHAPAALRLLGQPRKYSVPTCLVAAQVFQVLLRLTWPADDSLVYLHVYVAILEHRTLQLTNGSNTLDLQRLQSFQVYGCLRILECLAAVDALHRDNRLAIHALELLIENGQYLRGNHHYCCVFADLVMYGFAIRVAERWVSTLVADLHSKLSAFAEAILPSLLEEFCDANAESVKTIMTWVELLLHVKYDHNVSEVFIPPSGSEPPVWIECLDAYVGHEMKYYHVREHPRSVVETILPPLNAWWVMWHATNKKPTAKAATKKKPTAKASTKKKPTTKAATKKKPTAKAATKKKPTAKAATKKKPTAKASTKKKPTAKAAAKKKPTTKAATKKKPTAKASTKKKPTTKAAAKKKPLKLIFKKTKK